MKKYTKSVKFSDIPQGTWFKDGSGRKMLKLQTTNGNVTFRSYWGAVDNIDGTITDNGGTFNAVDDKGHRCKCPDWLEFLV